MTESEWMSKIRADRFPWMNDDQWECYLMLCEIYGGDHHVFGIVREGGRTGEVVEAEYDKTRLCSKEHWLVINNPTRFAHAGRELKRETSLDFEKVRFVGPSCALVPVGVSV